MKWNKISYKIMRLKGSFWNWNKMMGIIKALKFCQNLYLVAVCPCPRAFFKWWPWVDLDHFYDRVRFVSWSFCMGDSLHNIECSCFSNKNQKWDPLRAMKTFIRRKVGQVSSNSAYPQHSGDRYRTNGPLVFITSNGSMPFSANSTFNVWLSSRFTFWFTLRHALIVTLPLNYTTKDVPTRFSEQIFFLSHLI